jgi:hypothetical protein
MRTFTATRLGLCVALVAASSASASGGPAILGGTYGAGGVSFRGSDFRYAAIDTGRGGTIVEQIRTNGGGIRHYEAVGSGWSLPAVTLVGLPGGLSADGRRLALVRPAYGPSGAVTGHTAFRVLYTGSLKPARTIRLDGTYSFDAISPDGATLYLVEYASPNDPLDYRVRAYDVDAGEFRGGAIVDPDEPDEKMTGQPMSRVYSPDGAWAYTLYAGGREPFIHALDTAHGVAQCVDLDGVGALDTRGGAAIYKLGLGVDPATGAVTVLKGGEAVAAMDPATFAVGPPPAEPAADARVGSTADAGKAAGWVAPVAIGCGVLLLAAAALLATRRRPGAPA